MFHILRWSVFCSVKQGSVTSVGRFAAMRNKSFKKLSVNGKGVFNELGPNRLDNY